MYIGFSAYLDSVIATQSDFITEIDTELNIFLKFKNYGRGISKIYVGVLCVHPSHERYYAFRTPKLTKKKNDLIIQGDVEKLENIFEYDIKLPFDEFKNANAIQARTIVATIFYESLRALKEFEHFDKNALVEDVGIFFKNNNWLNINER